MTIKYTDNIKGFRRRKVLLKLGHLLQDILSNIEYIEDLMNYENEWMRDDEYLDWSFDLEFWQNNYSLVRTTYCLVGRGSSISRYDLKECNELIKMLHPVTI